MWCQGICSTLIQALAGCVMPPSHYLNQCCFRISDFYSKKKFKISLTDMCSNITFSKLEPHLPVANEYFLFLFHVCFCVKNMGKIIDSHIDHCTIIDVALHTHAELSYYHHSYLWMNKITVPRNIDPTHIAHSAALDEYLTMHNFVTEMCTFLLQNSALWTCAHICYKMVHYGV